MTTLALDNGLDTFGWSIVGTKGEPLDLGVIIQPAETKDEGIQHDRIRRARVQGDELVHVAQRYGIRRIVVETPSWPRRGKFTPIDPVAAISLSVGVAIGIAAVLDVPLDHVPPKTWQHAVLGVEKFKGKVDYDVVYADLETYVRTYGQAFIIAKLDAIAEGQRNHALDAIGVGVYAEIRGAA